jgi:hypothetical protein
LVLLSSNQAAVEARARRTVKKAGYIARKSRWRAGTIDNLGGFMLVEPFFYFVVADERFNLSPEAVIAHSVEDL